jgi:hypothetical protein
MGVKLALDVKGKNTDLRYVEWGAAGNIRTEEE